MIAEKMNGNDVLARQLGAVMTEQKSEKPKGEGSAVVFLPKEPGMAQAIESPRPRRRKKADHMVDAIRRRVERFGGVELELPPRGSIPEPFNFDQ